MGRRRVIKNRDLEFYGYVTVQWKPFRFSLVEGWLIIWVGQNFGGWDANLECDISAVPCHNFCGNLNREIRVVVRSDNKLFVTGYVSFM